MDKINVNLYGGKSLLFGGREKPLEADIIYCDRHDKCSFFKEGKCLNNRSFFQARCRYGRIETVTGYTSRARKYGAFKHKYQNDEAYNKLAYPTERVGVADDLLFLSTKYVNVRRGDDGEYQINSRNVLFATSAAFIPVSELTPDLLNAIFSEKPYDISYGEIKEYREKIVPELVTGIKKLLPEAYSELTAKYPHYAGIKADYVGREAYISSLRDGTVIEDRSGNRYTYKDGRLYCKAMETVFLPFGAKSADVAIDVTDGMTVKITDNSQCDENTRFK